MCNDYCYAQEHVYACSFKYTTKQPMSERIIQLLVYLVTYTTILEMLQKCYDANSLATTSAQ